jgi:hypothetical protein
MPDTNDYSDTIKMHIPLCRCGHFEDEHLTNSDGLFACQLSECGCMEFEDVDFLVAP